MDSLDATAVVELHTSRRARFDLDRARESLGAPEQAWLGVPATDLSDGAAVRSYHADLRMPVKLDGHEVAFQKAAIVELGPIDRVGGSLVVGISWRSANMAPLFPVLVGRLTLTSETVTLDGWYAPPGGRVGLALDRVLLGVAARRTARWFLAQLADAVGES
jgi:hypothetical protein